MQNQHRAVGYEPRSDDGADGSCWLDYPRIHGCGCSGQTQDHSIGYRPRPPGALSAQHDTRQGRQHANQEATAFSGTRLISSVASSPQCKYYKTTAGLTNCDFKRRCFSCNIGCAIRVVGKLDSDSRLENRLRGNQPHSPHRPRRSGHPRLQAHAARQHPDEHCQARSSDVAVRGPLSDTHSPRRTLSGVVLVTAGQVR